MELTGGYSTLHERINFRTLRLWFRIFRNESFDACGLQGSKASPFHHANMSIWADELGKMATSRLLSCSQLLRLRNLPILAIFVFVILLNSGLKSGQEDQSWIRVLLWRRPILQLGEPNPKTWNGKSVQTF